jgi:hypothetical protein
MPLLQSAHFRINETRAEIERYWVNGTALVDPEKEATSWGVGGGRFWHGLELIPRVEETYPPGTFVAAWTDAWALHVGTTLQGKVQQ